MEKNTKLKQQQPPPTPLGGSREPLSSSLVSMMVNDSHFLRQMGYLLGGQINMGAFSTVHCGIQVSNADVVAIKIIDLKNVSLNFRTRFLPRELANLKRLNHPNIIKVSSVAAVEHVCK